MNDKIKILLVEDNDGVLFNLRLALEMSNFIVDTATNGKEAILLLEHVVILPDIILSDIMMPEMGGYEFFEYVSSHTEWNTIPFIFLTAKTSPNDIRLGKILGADDYLIKPVKNDVLTKIINSKVIDATKEKITGEITRLCELNNVANEFSEKQLLLYHLSRDIETGIKHENLYSSLDEKTKQSVNNIGYQIASILLPPLASSKNISPRSYFIPIKSCNLKVFLLVDVYLEDKINYVVVLISKMLSYFKVLRIKYYFYELMNSDNHLDSMNFSSVTEEVKAILDTFGG